MHKLVFEEDVLPDGTEVAYYSHGEVAIKYLQQFCLIEVEFYFLSSDFLLAENVGRL